MFTIPTGKHVRFALAGALTLAVIIGVAMFANGSGGPETFRTVHPTRGEITSSVTSSGTITPVVTVTVGTPVSGIIKALSADYNSQVKKGQVIAQIDPATYSAQVEQSRGSYLAAVANLEKAKISLADAKRTMGRYKNLVKDGSVAVSDYDTYATAAASAQAAVGAAQGSLSQAKGAYDQARTNLNYTTITSPVDGIVISRSVEVGQTVAASLSAPTLFTIAQDLTKMQIFATVDESDIGKVHEGGNATFTVDAYPEAKFTGVVTQVRNAATTVSNVVTYTVVVGVDNADLKLKPGMTTNVRFEVAHKANALKVLNAALRFKPTTAEPAAKTSGPGGRHIYVLKDGKPVAVAVTLGISNDKETEIIADGLDENSPVILESLGTKKQASTSPLGMSGGMRPPR